MNVRRPVRSLARQFRPQVEALESRWCPSATITVSGHKMVITGDALADLITIRDNGNGGVSASVVSTAGKVTGSGTGITNIVVKGGKGSDKVDFALTNTLATNLDLDIGLGTGSDQATLNFADGVRGSSVNVDVDGSAGADLVPASLGDVSKSKVTFTGCLGRGPDSFAMDLDGDVTGGSTVGVSVNGAKGGDALHVNATGLDIGEDSKVAVTLNGGKGNDDIGLKYDGVLKGTLTVNLNGGAGADAITGNITAKAGSTGTLNAYEHGGKGNDALTLNVYDHGKLGDLDAVIYGGPGKDSFTHTPNVKVVP